MLTAQRIGLFVLIAALLGASTIAFALLLRLLFRRDGDEPRGPGWRKGWRIEEILRFVSGPFPLSIGLHAGVLLFLMAKVIEPTTPPPIMVRLESGGGGGGASESNPRLPELPDVALAERAPMDVERPPQITLPHLAPLPQAIIHGNEYNPGGFGAGTGGGSGGGAGGGIGSGYGPGMGPGFSEFTNTLRSSGLDMVLVIDGTGSMRFVIDDVKARMKALVQAVQGLVPAARIGIVVFGGSGERLAIEPFTLSTAQLLTFLTAIKAQNGGEWQEDTLAAVKAAVEQMAWRPEAKKVIVLVGDTPPPEDDGVEILHLIQKFHSEDGTFETVDVTVEEHERFARELYYSLHHRYPSTIPPPWAFDGQTQRSYREMARVGGGEWSSLTKDPQVNQQVLIMAFGRHWGSAVAEFKDVGKAGVGVSQPGAAQQGPAAAYAAREQVNATAPNAPVHTTQSAPAVEKGGNGMVHLQELLMSQAHSSDPARRAQLHREAIALLRSYYGDVRQWPLALAAVVHNVSNPEREFGASRNPFEQYLLAEVLVATHHPASAAKYYLQAARNGHYPQGYKYGIDIYYSQGRIDLIDAPLKELARQRRSPMAEWASYMRFKIAREQWEHSGMHDARPYEQWVEMARDYVSHYPRGRYADEPRFRLAEALQAEGKYADAASQYDQVKGDDFFVYAAAFKSAECRYSELAASAGKAGAMPADEKNNLTTAAIEGFRNTVLKGPEIEQRTPGQRQFIDTARGRSTYLLATMLEAQPRKDYVEIAKVLDGFDADYPFMSANFDQVAQWRLQALERSGQYVQAEAEINRLIAPGRRPQPSSDFVKVLGLELWKQSIARKEAGDNQGALADARLTALLYGRFEQQVESGQISPKDLTGTLSILGQAYVAMNDSARAKAIFEQVVKAAPSSPDANAGLARLAQAGKDYQQASDLWTRVESEASESDDLWYEARYNLALIYAADGNVKAACGKLAQTRSDHPSLGSPRMKERWDGLQRKLCLQNGVVGEAVPPDRAGKSKREGAHRMPRLSDRVPIPPPTNINVGLSSARETTMLKLFGKLGELTRDCSTPASSAMPAPLVEFKPQRRLINHYAASSV